MGGRRIRSWLANYVEEMVAGWSVLFSGIFICKYNV